MAGSELSLDEQGIHLVVGRYCRARLSGSPSDHPVADHLAASITSRILRNHGTELAGPAPVEAIVYADMSAAVSGFLDAGSTALRGSPLDALPPRPREVLILRAFVGLTAEQVGRALGVSAETVRREQLDALAQLLPPRTG